MTVLLYMHKENMSFGNQFVVDNVPFDAAHHIVEHTPTPTVITEDYGILGLKMGTNRQAPSNDNFLFLDHIYPHLGTKQFAF